MIEIGVEPFSRSLFDELLPLARACWKESTTIKAESCAYYGERDFEIEPDFEGYKRLSDIGALVIVTLRDDGKLSGYVVGFTYHTLHHKRLLGAICDTIYLEPPLRAYSPVMVEVFEREMADRNVQIIGWPTHENGPVYTLLKSMGYVGDDIVMEKRLKCASQLQ